MRIMLTGANGQLGRSLQAVFPNEWQLLAVDKARLDITDLTKVDDYIADYRPDIVINAAAYTAVDKAESEKDKAKGINELGPKNLALAAKKYQLRLIHLSTDYVFDGNQCRPYVEIDKTSPLNIYGQTKLAGEMAAMRIWAENTVVIRTSWIFSEYGHNFVKTMVKLASEKDILHIVNDQIGCPTYAGDVAQCIIKLIKARCQPGIYHYCGANAMSWLDFASRIITTAYQENKLKILPQLIGIATQAYPKLATRPKFSVMDCRKVNQYQVNYSDLTVALRHVIHSQ